MVYRHRPNWDHNCDRLVSLCPQNLFWGNTRTHFLGFRIVSCIPIARQRLDKHILAEANACNNKTSFARHWISKHASLTTEAIFSAWSLQSGYKEVFGWEESVVVRSWECSVEEEFIWEICCLEMGWVLEMAVEGNWKEMARNELDCEEATLYVIWSGTETVIFADKRRSLGRYNSLADYGHGF
jgi:hypothetical protein